MKPHETAPDEGLKQERQSLIQKVLEKPAGLAWCSLHSALADRVIQAVFHEAMASFEAPPRLCLAATGGYGRRELSPWSDLDLAIVPLDDTHPDLDRVMKAVFGGLQARCGGGLGLKVGYSFRPLSEVPGLDAPTRTALLDARLVAGSEEAFDALMEEVWREFPAADFILAKILERKAAFAKWHDTPLVTRPHLKEGAGGLRCFHASNWIGMALGERPQRPAPGYDRVLRIRNLVHALAGRPCEELSFEKRKAAADVLGYEPDHLASLLSEDMLSLHEIWLDRLESLPKSRFRLTRRTWAEGGEVRVARNASPTEAAVAVSLGIALGVKPPLAMGELKAGRLSPDLLSVVSRGERTVRALDQAGLLEQILPELTLCRHLMPRDGVHRYTVFEHTLRALRRLEALHENEPLGDIKAGIRNPGLLYLALLLHDAGKADPSRDHADAGAKLAEVVCRRWGLSRSESETVAWLVRNHLVMSRFISIRDVQNPETVYEFAQLVKTEDRLDLLTLLTWADVSAVSPEAWTQAMEAFTLHLNRSARAVITENSPRPSPLDARKRISRQLAKTPVDDAEIEALLARMPAHYVFATPPERVALHWEMLSHMAAEGPVIRTLDRSDLSTTEFHICAPDRHGLLSEILAVFYAHDLRLSGVRASTSAGRNPAAVDVVMAGLGERPVPRHAAAKLASDLGAVLRKELDPDELLADRGKDPHRMQEILRWQWHPGSPGHLEVRAPRGRGLAYRISKLIFEQGWNIEGAMVSQWAGQGAASFTVTRPDGLPLHSDDLERVMDLGARDRRQV